MPITGQILHGLQILCHSCFHSFLQGDRDNFSDNVIFLLVSPRALSSKIFVKETMKQYRYIFINIVGDGVVTSVAFMVICDL